MKRFTMALAGLALIGCAGCTMANGSSPTYGATGPGGASGPAPSSATGSAPANTSGAGQAATPPGTGAGTQ